jgi:hypothetical protein
MSPLFERIELLLPLQSPAENSSSPTMTTSIQAFTAHGQTYIQSVSMKRHESWSHVTTKRTRMTHHKGATETHGVTPAVTKDT